MYNSDGIRPDKNLSFDEFFYTAWSLVILWGSVCFYGDIPNFWGWGTFAGVSLSPIPWRISSLGR